MLSNNIPIIALCCLLMTMGAEAWTDLIIGAGQAAIDMAPNLVTDALTFSSEWLDATAAAAVATEALHDAALGLLALSGY